MLEHAKEAISWGGRKLSGFFTDTPHEQALQKLDAAARRARVLGLAPEQSPDYIRAEMAVRKYEKAKGPSLLPLI